MALPAALSDGYVVPRTCTTGLPSGPVMVMALNTSRLCLAMKLDPGISGSLDTRATRARRCRRGRRFAVLVVRIRFLRFGHCLPPFTHTSLTLAQKKVKSFQPLLLSFVK